MMMLMNVRVMFRSERGVNIEERTNIRRIRKFPAFHQADAANVNQNLDILGKSGRMMELQVSD